MLDRIQAFHRRPLFVATLMVKRLVLIPILLATFSCASALTGTRETITVESTPQSADATLFCGVTRIGNAVTPATFSIARNAGDCTLTVSKTGYTDEKASIEQGMNPVYWANLIGAPLAQVGAFAVSWGAPAGAGLIVAGTAGWAIDYWTGAIHTHRPKKVRLTLQPKESE